MGIAFQFLTQLFVERFATLALIKLLQSSVIMELDYMPTVAKTTKAIHQPSSDKILGEDGISPELNKHGGDALVAALSRLFKHLWLKEKVPQEFKDT